VTQIAVNGIAVEFGGAPVLQDVTFTVSHGDRWGIVGRNGSGKTTLLRVVTGELEPSRGSVFRAAGSRMAILEQHRDFGEAKTVWEAAAGPFAELMALELALAAQAEEIGRLGQATPPALLARYDRDLERFQREGGYTAAPRVDAVLHGLGFDPERARRQPLAQLSGGERGRVGLARQLVAPADVLLLDEPTNHLDLETTAWLEDYIRGLDATVLVISHDRAFLEDIVDHVLHVEDGSAVPYTGSYDAFVEQRAAARLARERAFQQQQRVVAKEEDYIRRNIAGGNSRQAKGRRKRLARVPRLSPPPGEDGAMALRLGARARGGDQVLVLRDVGLAVEGRTLLQHFSSRLERGEIVGLVGPNGSGKSTLLSGIAGLRPPEQGELRVGESIDVAFYRQDLTQVPAGKTLFEIVHDLRPMWDRGQVQNHLGRFAFSGETVQRRTDTLSGGELARIGLAMLMLSRANFLLLDEPTNHLDVESIEALEDALEDYEGTVLLVSHDRALLRALTTRVWVLHGMRMSDFPGGFAEWEVASRERAHAAAVAAAEEEVARRVRERERTRRQEDRARPDRGALRAARLAVEAAEGEVARLEARVEELRAVLEDPALYTTPDGARRATELGRELDQARAALDGAFERWGAATQLLESARP
jgi:ATP-binding cassette subfamily F protein 3